MRKVAKGSDSSKGRVTRGTPNKTSPRSSTQSTGTNGVTKTSPRSSRLKRRLDSVSTERSNDKKPKSESKSKSRRDATPEERDDDSPVEDDYSDGEVSFTATPSKKNPSQRSPAGNKRTSERSLRKTPTPNGRRSSPRNRAESSSQNDVKTGDKTGSRLRGRPRKETTDQLDSNSGNHSTKSRAGGNKTVNGNRNNVDTEEESTEEHGASESGSESPVGRKSKVEESKKSARELKNLGIWHKDKVVHPLQFRPGKRKSVNSQGSDKVTLISEDSESEIEDQSNDDEDDDDESSTAGLMSEDESEISEDESTNSGEIVVKRGSEKLKKSTNDAHSLRDKVKELEEMLLEVEQQYQDKLKKKEQQLEEMNELATKNMEMEAKISFMLSGKENYDKEVRRIKEDEEEQVKKEKEEKEIVEKKKKEAEEKEKKDATKLKGKEEKKSKKGDKRKRRSRKNKEEESEGEDIDALFVSDTEDNDIEVVGEKKGRVKKGSDTNVSSKDVVEIVDEDFAEGKEKTPKKTDSKNKTEIKGDEENEDDDDDDKHGRHNIRKLMGSKKLQEETVKAAKTEKERRERAKKEHDKHLVVTEKNPKTNITICKQLVLAFKEGTKEPLVEVNSKLIKKLKPHQIEGVEFMWDSVIESMDRLKSDEEGQGVILAHCMGLGKTLSVITLVHTLLKTKAVAFKHCLVVCPLNTVLNWQYEWKKWLDKKDRIHTYEMASCKHNHDRAKLLSEWHHKGGIMIMGYQLFRILANYPGRSKKNRKIFTETLLDPGPHLVVCDEGHMLKNDATAISKAMNSMKTKRRIVLTGTPLQNNLAEYHCMMSFVKPSLLGTMREFKNRFVNPISNGQHSDSTPTDVKVMKRRAHVLHQMLEGCVQRKDYSELNKLLPPKHEYVILIRLSELQMELYEKYLELHRPAAGSGGPTFGAGAGLFADYQALMRIWTHPYVLKLDEERQERKALLLQDDELDTSEDDDEDIFISSDTEEDGTTTTVVSSSSEDEDSGNEEGSSSNSSEVNGDAPYKPKRRKLRKKEEKEKNVKNPRDRSSKNAKVKGEDKESISKETRNGRSSKRQKEQEIKDQKDQCIQGKKLPTLKVALKDIKIKKDKAELDKSSKESSDIEILDEEGSTSSKDQDIQLPNNIERKAKVLAGEVIRKWGTVSRHGGNEPLNMNALTKKEDPWWTKIVNQEEHMTKLEISGKLVFLMEVLRLAESLGDKILVFSQSLLSLNLIETFLKFKTEEAELQKCKKGQKPSLWIKDEDYLRMDGSTGVLCRSRLTSEFNDVKNKRLRLFLISTKAGGLGINLEAANRVIIFDASWNPSHDIQSIFRVYRFGQVKPVYVYRLLAQGTMEEKIYERQVAKETLSQRVIDEHQIDRHFTASDLAELYRFHPDRLNDPNCPKRPTPPVPKDIVLAEMVTSLKEWVVHYHEHDSLLENRPEQDLTEEEREAAWEEYEREKKGIFLYGGPSIAKPHPSYNRPDLLPAISLTSNYNNMPFRPPGHLTNTNINVGNRLQYFGTNTVPITNKGGVQIGTARPVFTGPLPSSGTTSAVPSVSGATKEFQIAQLPRVVQEIIKYNPSIGQDELQKRLQAFLGMQNRYPASNVAAAIQNPAGAAPSGSQGNESSDSDTAGLPSRLPQPGRVPATASK